jgi:hypothetical protein
MFLVGAVQGSGGKSALSRGFQVEPGFPTHTDSWFPVGLVPGTSRSPS